MLIMPMACNSLVDDVVISKDASGNVVALNRECHEICENSPTACIQEAIDYVKDGQSVITIGDANTLNVNAKIRIPSNKARLRLRLGEVRCNTGDESCLFIDGFAHDVYIQSLLNVGDSKIGLEITGSNHRVYVGFIGLENAPHNKEGKPWMFMDKAIYVHPPFDRDGYAGFLNVEVGSIHCGYRDQDKGVNVAVCKGIVVEGNDLRGFSIEGSVFTVRGSIRLARRGLELGNSVFWDRFFLDIDPDLALNSDYLIYFADGKYDCCTSPIRKQQPYRTQYEGAAFNTVDLYGWTPANTRKTIYFGEHTLGNRITAAAIVDASTIEFKDEFRNFIVNQGTIIQGSLTGSGVALMNGELHLWGREPALSLSGSSLMNPGTETSIRYVDKSISLSLNNVKFISISSNGIESIGIPVMQHCPGLSDEGKFNGQLLSCYDDSMKKWRLVMWIDSRWVYLT